MAGRKPKIELTPEQKAEAAAKRAAEKAAKFIELADKRVSKVLDALAGVAALSNKNSYAYTTAQVAAIFRVIERDLTTLQGRFAPDAKAATGAFSLAAAVAEMAPADASEGEKTEG